MRPWSHDYLQNWVIRHSDVMSISNSRKILLLRTMLSLQFFLEVWLHSGISLVVLICFWTPFTLIHVLAPDSDNDSFFYPLTFIILLALSFLASTTTFIDRPVWFTAPHNGEMALISHGRRKSDRNEMWYRKEGWEIWESGREICL